MFLKRAQRYSIINWMELLLFSVCILSFYFWLKHHFSFNNIVLSQFQLHVSQIKKKGIIKLTVNEVQEGQQRLPTEPATPAKNHSQSAGCAKDETLIELLHKLNLPVKHPLTLLDQPLLKLSILIARFRLIGSIFNFNSRSCIANSFSKIMSPHRQGSHKR